MSAPALQYARTSDGVDIAYFSLGRGPSIVFASNIWGDANMYAAPHPHTRYMTDRLAELGWRVIRYDVRGFGASQRDVADMSLETRLLDLAAVADSLKLTSFVVAGQDASSAVALTYAATRPERVRAVVALNGWAVGSERASATPAWQAVLSLEGLASTSWEFFALALAKLVTELDNPAHTQELAALFRRSSSIATHHAFMHSLATIDIRPLLPSISVPVLVVHDTGFPFGSLPLCRDLVSALPDGRLVVVPGDRDAEIEAIDSFLRATVAEGLRPGPAGPAAQLTPRETEVLRLIASGRTNREISDDLVLSVRTVARHITNVYAKIGARGKAEATAYALRHNLT